MSALARFIGMWLLAAMVLLSPADAQTFPALTGRVVDQADLLDPTQEIDLTRKLEDFETRSGRQLVVATVSSLENYDPNDYATRLGREWKIGDEQKDDGVVFLIAPNDRKVYIATGYGADDYLTDAMTGLIIREQILPRFKAGDFSGGINAGTDGIIQQLELPPEEAARRAKAAEQQMASRGSDREFSLIPMIFIMIVFFMIIGGISSAARGGKRYRGKGGKRRGGGVDPMVVLWGLEVLSHVARGGRGGGGGGWGGGGFGGGGGFSGGGGSFGGGGAGGSW